MNQEGDFVKVLSRKDVLALAFGAMIGWGWVVLAGSWVSLAGSVGAMLAFLIGGIMIIFIGLTYSELTSAMPKVGGGHVFSYRALGMDMSFVCTWAMILGYISVVAFEAVALPTVVEYLFPNYMKGYLWTIAGWDVYASWVAVGVIGSIAIMIINLIGIRFAAFIQFVFTVVIIIVGLLLVGGSAINGGIENMQPLFTKGMKGIFPVLIMTPFMFVGFDVIPQAVEEMNIPYKTIGIILIISVLMAALWYILIIMGVSLALSPSQMNNASLVTADAMSVLYKGRWAGNILIIAGICGIVTSWNAFYIGGSRAIFAMAQAKMLPQFLGRIHPKYKTPYNAILLIGIISIIAPLFGRKMLVWLVDAGGLGIVIAYFVVALSFLILKYREPNLNRPFEVKNGKLVGCLAVGFSLILIFLYLPGSPSALLWPYEWSIFLGWTLLGLIFYVWARLSYGKSEVDKMMHLHVYGVKKTI